jgi:cytochrome b
MSPESVLRSARVWDLPTRAFHWLLAATVVASIVSAKIGGNAMAWHMRFGLLAMALLLFRLAWGFAGGHWSRFSSFVYGPADRPGATTSGTARSARCRCSRCWRCSSARWPPA